MKDEQIAQIVREAIDLATENTGWSRAQLGRRIGVSIATIHRWHSNTADRYHLSKLAKIFDYAGLSLDEKFGVGRDRELEPAAAEGIEALRGDVQELKDALHEIQEQLSAMRPAAELLQLVAAAAVSLSRSSGPELDELMAHRSTAAFGQQSASRALDNARATVEKLASDTGGDKLPADGQDELLA